MMQLSQIYSENNSASVDEDIRQLVIARVRATPKDVMVSIGSQDYTKDQLIENVESNSEVGREIIEIQMQYLRDLASGAIYAE